MFKLDHRLRTFWDYFIYVLDAYAAKESHQFTSSPLQSNFTCSISPVLKNVSSEVPKEETHVPQSCTTLSKASTPSAIESPHGFQDSSSTVTSTILSPEAQEMETVFPSEYTIGATGLKQRKATTVLRETHF